MKIYKFIYTDNDWESAYATISIHRTRKSAVKAMEAHKAAKVAAYPDWKVEMIKESRNMADWAVVEAELLD